MLNGYTHNKRNNYLLFSVQNTHVIGKTFVFFVAQLVMCFNVLRGSQRLFGRQITV